MICEHLLSADNPMAIGERRSRPVSMPPQECDLLLPDFDHCIIESSDIFLSLFNGLLLGDLLCHDAKISGNNLAWKDIG